MENRKIKDTYEDEQVFKRSEKGSRKKKGKK